MATLNPILTATPGNPPIYNVGMAETFSWIPVENDANRPIFARATYLTNASDISVSLSAGNINVSLDDVEASLDNVQTLLSDLTSVDYATSVKQDVTNTLLDSLTSSNQQISIDSSSSVTLLNELTSSNIHVAGFNIPPYDEINLEYEGTTDYIRKVSYLESSTTVLSLSFVYVTEPPTSADNRILKVKRL
jgi:hypothetical protein